jgi:hypothetical protein
VVWLYAGTMFLSALLLFLVQPMVGKMILPLLGGTPAVWNTCMVFFQAALLLGYAYAHVTSMRLGVRRQAGLHLLVLLAPLAVLPIAVAHDATPPTSDNPVWWLLWRLTVTVGLPFFVVATSAPLLQRWFVGTGHPDGRDPYFLYAASNLGSLLALLGYPLLIESSLWLDEQSWLWAAGYTLLIATNFACAVALWRAPRSAIVGDRAAEVAGDGRGTRPTRGSAATCGGASAARSVGAAAIGADRDDKPTLRNRAWWVFTAFVPSSLMLGVTTHITTNLAAAPLLWVLPLAIYLLTFVFVFARKPPISHAKICGLLPYAVLPLAMLVFVELPKMGWTLIPAHLLVFFVAAMVCHGELARSRPPARHLTEFYLWMSVGGVLGGLFNAVVAPLLFTNVIEYPLVLVLALLVRPGHAGHEESRRISPLDLLLPAGLGLIAIAVAGGVHALPIDSRLLGTLLVFAPPAILCVPFNRRPARFALGFAALLLACGWYAESRRGQVLYAQRNFFGLKRVTLVGAAEFVALYHGSTMHGCQSLDPQRRREPLSYYHPSGPVGDVFEAFNQAQPNPRVAVIGLGSGSMAAYAEPGQHFTFYEIDPAVARIAENPDYFTFLTDCRSAYQIVLGDGRLTLARRPDNHYGLIVLDAFGSDAIPTHLLSREAIRLYMRKLDVTGMLVFHVSNRYLNLRPLLANLAAEAGLTCVTRADANTTPGAEGKLASEYVAIARRPEDVRLLVEDHGWRPLHGSLHAEVWSDQFSNLLSVIRWY